MNLQSFENLELIPTLLTKIEDLEKRLLMFTPELTTKKNVIAFLNISNTTYYEYFKDGRFKEGYHFYRKNGKIHFVENAILELKNNPL